MLSRDLQNVLMVSSNVKKVRRQNVAPFINLPQCMPFCSTTTLVGRPKKPGKTMSAESRNGNKTA